MTGIKDLISLMTLEEKASLCSGRDFWYLQGIERLGITPIMLTDGPHGLRKQAGDPDHVGLHNSIPATCFPTASALASTWNRELVYQVGKALGEECRQEKVGVILGPGLNIKRSPLCGRNFEYFSEDPYLAGEIASSYINGVQSQGIGTSLKHFAANNQEYRRMVIDAIIDERALREIYLAGFEIAVKAAQPWTVMGAYNRLNGTYCCENPDLLKRILREEWGFEGLVVTDWGAMNDPIQALRAGLDLEMPGPARDSRERIISAVECGELDGQALDLAVERILRLIFSAREALSQGFVYHRGDHHALARRAAGEGAVLLKNERGCLPLDKGARVALLGRFAKHPRYQGAGSSLINPTRLENLHDELAALIGPENLLYAPGYTARGDRPQPGLIQEAVSTAQAADVVVLCAGLTDLDEVEGVDREHLKMPLGHDALIKAVAEINDRVIVVLSSGAPVEMPWVKDVPAVLEGYLGGQAGAGAAADILVGITNPSGKLAETFPIRLEDNPSYPYFPGGPGTVEYRESIFVGYRFYDKVDQEVLFPFGHGLSYTSFEYKDLLLNRERTTELEDLGVSLKVRNSGSMAGKEVIQLYVRDLESSVFRPVKELKAFRKIELQPGEESEVAFELSRRAFAFYDPESMDWVVEQGQFEILIGSSSRDIRLSAVVEITSAPIQRSSPDITRSDPYCNLRQGVPISGDDFEALLGRHLPPNQSSRKGQFTINTPIGDLDTTFPGWLFTKYLKSRLAEMTRGQEGTPAALLMDAMVREMPLRGLLMSGGDAVTRKMLAALLLIFNGKIIRGLGELIRYVRNNDH